MYISWCFSVIKIAKQNTRNRWFLAFFGNFYTFSKFPWNNGHLLLRKHPALEESLVCEITLQLKRLLQKVTDTIFHCVRKFEFSLQSQTNTRIVLNKDPFFIYKNEDSHFYNSMKVQMKSYICFSYMEISPFWKELIVLHIK